MRKNDWDLIEKGSRNSIHLSMNEIPASGFISILKVYNFCTPFTLRMVSYTIGAAINKVE